MGNAIAQRDDRPLLRAVDLRKTFDLRRGITARFEPRASRQLHAVDGVSFDIARGGTLGLIGESGCGKSTLARVLLRLVEPSSGRIEFDGADITVASKAALRALRARMQMVFQDPYASLNPRKTIEEIIALPLRVHRRMSAREARDEVVAMLERVGLNASHLNRFPHQFSGGQRQRIGIARALVLKPEFLVCDEPVSALDVSIQAQILHLLQSLQRELGLTQLFIGHNLSVVGYVSDRVAVMYLGEIVEIGPAVEVLKQPKHPYTRALLAAVPRLARGEKRPARIADDPASALHSPAGCRFHPRCPHALEACRRVRPILQVSAVGHEVACHLYDGISAPQSNGSAPTLPPHSAT